MKTHLELTDSEFQNRFIECKLDPSVFNHEAHLRLAWVTIKKHGIEEAEKNIQAQLKKYVQFVGAQDKYNTTLTVVAIKIVYHFMLKSKAKNFVDFIAEFMQLKTNFKQLIEAHYSFDIFDSEIAKTKYLEPDLLQFN